MSTCNGVEAASSDFLLGWTHCIKVHKVNDCMVKCKINVLSSLFLVFPSVSQLIITSKNQRLQSAGDKDRMSKRFCSKAVIFA